MNIELKQLQKLVENVDPKFLMMARKNCHASNVSSIVLGNSPHGGLARVFLAWPGHKLHTNKLNDEMIVGIHDHRSDINLSLIVGDVTNTNYIETQNYGTKLNKWKFVSGVVNGSPKIENNGTTFIIPTTAVKLHKNKVYSLTANELHDVSCDGIAAWYVYEGEVKQTVTTLYTKTDTVNVAGLYDVFVNTQEVKDHVNEFIALCLKQKI